MFLPRLPDSFALPLVGLTGLLALSACSDECNNPCDTTTIEPGESLDDSSGACCDTVSGTVSGSSGGSSGSSGSDDYSAFVELVAPPGFSGNVLVEDPDDVTVVAEGVSSFTYEHTDSADGSWRIFTWDIDGYITTDQSVSFYTADNGTTVDSLSWDFEGAYGVSFDRNCARDDDPDDFEYHIATEVDYNDDYGYRLVTLTDIGGGTMVVTSNTIGGGQDGYTISGTIDPGNNLVEYTVTSPSGEVTGSATFNCPP